MTVCDVDLLPLSCHLSAHSQTAHIESLKVEQIFAISSISKASIDELSKAAAAVQVSRLDKCGSLLPLISVDVVDFHAAQ